MTLAWQTAAVDEQLAFALDENDRQEAFGPGGRCADGGGIGCFVLTTRHPWPHQRRLAGGIHAMDGEDVLGEIDADGDNGHDFPFHKTSELMRFRTSHRGTWMPFTATAQITWDGEVPFIR